ncbi:DUF2306 domain-containing protein [Nocardioides sp. WV_118_6]
MAFWVVAVVAIGYFPLAFTYGWHFFAADAPRLQDHLQGAVVSHDFAFGHGSVVQLRAEDYREHRVVMLVHTSTGALALALAMLQFSPRLRATRPAVHRYAGRVYLALMATSMLAAYAFLLGSPVIDYFGGSAFDLQLWGLATGTLGSAAYALWAIRRRDVVTHRAWMTMNIAFLLTAPLLRVLWVGLGRIDEGLELMVSLDSGASTLAIVAPGGGAIAFLLTQRATRRADVAPNARLQYAAAVVVAALGSLWLLDRFGRLPAEAPGALLWAGHLLPAWGLLAICLVGAVRAGRAGQGIGEQRWRWLAWGAALATPVTALVVVAATPSYGLVDGFLAGQMLAPVTPILVAFALIVHTAAPRRRVRGAAAAPAEERAGTIVG